MNDTPIHLIPPRTAWQEWTRSYRELSYFLDADGNLWKGPTSPEDNIHFAMFGGMSDHGQVWTGFSSNPDAAWACITPYQAARHLKEAADKFVRDREERARLKAVSEGALLCDVQGNKSCPNCGRRLEPDSGHFDVHYRRDARGVPIYECEREWWKSGGPR